MLRFRAVCRQACVLSPTLATLACSAALGRAAPEQPTSGEQCVVRVENVAGAQVVLVHAARMPRRKAALDGLPIVFASASSRRGIVPSSERMTQTAAEIARDALIGIFVQEMMKDSEVTYYVWDSNLLNRSGGGLTTHCREDRFDIWINFEHHLTTEGKRCANPKGSGNLRSLLAHELGHAWAWRHYGDDDPCDNASPGNKISVAWESSQLAADFERLTHNRPGCACDAR